MKERKKIMNIRQIRIFGYFTAVCLIAMLGLMGCAGFNESTRITWTQSMYDHTEPLDPLVCFKCKTKNTPGSKFCDNCGTKLGEDSYVSWRAEMVKQHGAVIMHHMMPKPGMSLISGHPNRGILQ